MRDAVSRSGLTIAEAMLSNKVLLVEGPGDITLFRTLIELQTGKTAEQQDIHIVSGSGKGGITPLAAILQELGANYVAIFDWDACIDTSFPMFKTLTSTTRTALIVKLTTLAAEMRSLSSKKKTKPQKLVTSMMEELKNPPAFIPDFKRSELGEFLSAVHQMNPGPVDAVGALCNKGMRKYQPELAKHRAWLWSASPEEILIPDHSAEVIAANELVNMGALAALPSQQNYRDTVINKAHDLAHEPERQIRLIRKLWDAGAVRKNEIKKAVQFCL